MTWNFNMDEAPKGRMVTKTITTTKGDRTTEEFVPDAVLVASNCGLVLKSHWMPPKLTQSGSLLDGNRWSGFGVDKGPIAWMPLPVHPHHEQKAA